MNLGLIPSIFLFFGVLSLVYSAALYQYKNARYQKVIEHWSLGTLLSGIAILLTIFRGDIPLLVSYFFANALFFTATAEFNKGLRRLARDDQTSIDARWLDALLFLAYMGALLVIDALTPAEYRETAKTSFVSATIVVLSILGARHCFEFSRKHSITLAAIFGYLFVAVALLWGLRIVAAVARLGTYAFDATPLNTVVFVLIFITGVLRYLIFPLVLLQKTEIDKQVQLKQSLVRASKTATAGALTASIAHELGQPLAAARIHAQVLRKALQDTRAGQHAVDTTQWQVLVNDIIEENERAARIIGSLRTMFSPSHAMATEVDLGLLIHKTSALVRKEIERHKIELTLSISGDLRVAIAEDEFQQVLLNLMLNSIEALQERPIEEDRTLRITASTEGPSVRIAVADNGPGVGKDMQASLFEILSTSKATGMGVGLWLSKYIVERHSGTIAHTPVPSGGSCFTITLPVYPDKTLGQGATLV